MIGPSPGKMENPSEEISPTGAAKGPRVRTTWGFVLASLASGYASPLLLVALPGLLRGNSRGLVSLWAFVNLPGLFTLLLLGLLVSCLIVLLAGIPATLVIDFAEARGLRSVGFYAAAGALIGMVWGGVVALGASTLPSALELVLVLGVAGLIGGLVYWSIAGRSAGDWRVVERSLP